jgi:hypothetical protein
MLLKRQDRMKLCFDFPLVTSSWYHVWILELKRLFQFLSLHALSLLHLPARQIS